MNSCRADSHVNFLKTSDVSETHSVSILRESDLRMERECVSETSEVFKQITRLSAREDFIKFCRRESLKRLFVLAQTVVPG
jgi:hypothetical protein